MKDNVWDQVIQRNTEIMKEAMKKSRSRQAEASSNERDKKDDLTRTRSRNPILA
jgi:polyhydroxyalkanoate synthesis regulator protein